jgi:hypothetical protein
LKKNNKSSNDDFIYKFKKTFGLKTVSDVSERFEGDIVFNTLDDVTKNIKEYLKYAASSVDMNEINSLLKNNGLNKTAETIFDEHKNLDSDKFISKLQIAPIIQSNLYNSFKYNNEEEINKKFRINVIILIHFTNLQINKQKNSSAEIILNDDFMTNNNLIFYIRTSNNKNIPFSSATEILDDTDDMDVTDCYENNILCKHILDINKLITDNKTFYINNLENGNKLIKLSFVKFLFDLNNIDNNGNPISSPINIPDKINTDFTELQKIFLK